MTTDINYKSGRLLAIAKYLAITLGAVVLILCVWMAYARIRIAGVETQPRLHPTLANESWLRAHDVDIHLQEWGPKTAKPLLLVHGTGAWTGTWVSNVDAMVAAGFRVVAMDLPPFGFSTLPTNADYSRLAQAKRIQAVLNQLGDQPVTLLGHSFGGGPALETALLDNGRITHLVLVDAAIGMQASLAATCQPSALVQTLMGWRPMRTTLIAAVGTDPHFSQALLRKFVARKDVVTIERTAIYQQPFVNQDFTAALGDWAYQFATGCEIPMSVQPEQVKKLSIPMSLVWGEQDTITPLVQAHGLKNLVANSRLTVLPGVGHIPQIEDVAAFNAVIAKVLQTLPTDK